eukprot:7670549-Ditylum_brightwellii.AAC.1
MASIRQLSISASVVTVGALVLSLGIYCLCFLPSAQPWPLILPQHFLVRNIRLHYHPIVQLFKFTQHCLCSSHAKDTKGF